MKICLAQTRPVAGDVESNLARHRKLVELAASYDAGMIIFPELSLTGYEPKLAKRLATDLDDDRFEGFQALSDSRRLTIGVGMPIAGEAGVLIGMVIFQANRPRQVYFKQRLHSDELPYFAPGNREVFLELDQRKVAPAICYESLLPMHSEKAARNGASFYVASVAKSARGVEKARLHFPEVARKHSMTVLMANCVGPCDDFVGAGQTAVWNRQGVVVGQLDESSEGLLIFDDANGEKGADSEKSAPRVLSVCFPP